VAADAEDDDVLQAELQFSQTTCDCGAVHPTAVRCVCGAPRSFDFAVEDRRRLVSRAYATVVTFDPTGVVEERTAVRWYQRLRGWYPSFMGGCRAVADGEGSGPLTTALCDLVSLHAEVAATPRLRPDFVTWANIDAALDTFVETAHCFLEGLTTVEHTVAEQSALDGQAAIDRFTAELDVLNTKRDRWAELGVKLETATGPFDPEVLTVESARTSVEAASIIDLDEMGQRFVERVTGGTPLPGVGAWFVVLDAYIEELLNRARVWDIAHRTFVALAGPAGLSAVAASPSWRIDMNVLNQELLDLGLELRRTNFDAPRPAARAFIRVGHLLTERVGKYLLATVLAARGRDYERLRDYDVGALLGEVAQAGLGDISLGWDKALRHGDAHGEFTVEDDGVRFTAEKREYDFLTWDELGERVLAAYESVIAVNAGLACALESLGLDLPDINALDVSVEDQVRFVMALLGFSDTEVTIDGDQLTVRARADESPDMLCTAAAAWRPLPNRVTTAVFEITDTQGIRRWEGPLGALRKFATEHSELAKQTRILEVRRRWTCDGVPVQSEAWVRGYAAAVVAGAPEEPAEKLRVLDPLAQMARRLDDRELVETLGRVRRGYAAVRAGRRPAASFKPAVDTLVSYYHAAQDEAA
jgi:hypothetical protein